MVVKRGFARFLLWLALLGVGLAAPAAAHKGHHKEPERSAAVAQAHQPPAEVHEAAAPQSGPERLLSWLGRIHPFAVHFPIALFPVAWFALIAGRRRPDAAPLVRALVVAAGAAAVLAAPLGWLDAVFAESETGWLLTWHSRIGTMLGLIGAAVALAAWRRPALAQSRTMVWTLGSATALLMVQGWLGAALVHGIDHMNW